MCACERVCVCEREGMYVSVCGCIPASFNFMNIFSKSSLLYSISLSLVVYCP